MSIDVGNMELKEVLLPTTSNFNNIDVENLEYKEKLFNQNNINSENLEFREELSSRDNSKNDKMLSKCKIIIFTILMVASLVNSFIFNFYTIQGDNWKATLILRAISYSGFIISLSFLIPLNYESTVFIIVKIFLRLLGICFVILGALSIPIEDNSLAIWILGSLIAFIPEIVIVYNKISVYYYFMY